MRPNPRRAATALLLTLCLGTVPAGAAGDGPTIETFAGGIPSGQPGPTVSVKPVGIDYDDAGNLFIADPGQGVIWKLDTDGALHHVAGSGVLCLPAGDACTGPGRTREDVFLRTPAGLALASDGDIFFSEMRGHAVRRIDVQTGSISLVAGTGMSGFSGDGGPATEAQLWLPQSLAVDSQDRLYIADIGNRRIRRVEPDGTIDTVAGCGSQQFPACWYFAQDGSPVESTPIGANAGINGNGWGIAIDDADRLYIADVAQVIMLDEERGEYRVIGGKAFDYASLPGQGENGPVRDARFSVIVAMAFAPSGDLYLLEGGGSHSSPWNRIQKIEAPVTPDSILRHVGGKGIGNGSSGDGGPATNATFAFSQPTGTWSGQGIAVGPDGTVAVSDVRNERLRAIDPAGVVRTVAGNGYGGADYIFRTFNLTPSNTIPGGMTSRGGLSGDGREATQAQLYFPVDVEVDRGGNVYVLDYGSHRVRKITPDGTISTIVGTGCVGERDCWSKRRDAALGDGGPASQAQLFEPMAIALDRTGTQLYIADSAHARVRQVNLGHATFTAYPLSANPISIDPGEIATVVGPGAPGCSLAKPACEGLPAPQYPVTEPTGVATDAAGNLYVSDEYAGVVSKVDLATSTVTTVAGVAHYTDCDGTSEDGPGRVTRLCGPGDLDVAGSSLFITETGYPGTADSLAHGFKAASRVRRVDLSSPAHLVSTVAGVGTLGFSGDGGAATGSMLALPHGVAAAPDGTVYIGDSGNSRVRKVAADGTISTVAGSGEYFGYYDHVGCDFAGDAGPASSALLCAPMGMDVGPDGALYVADTANNRIRVIRGL